MEVAHREMTKHADEIRGLKNYMVDQLKTHIQGVSFNGDISNDSLYTVLNVSCPENEINEMLLFNLDINGIAASGGSACSSGSEIGSHVLRAIQANVKRANVRFSFSKYNTKADIDFTIGKLKEIYHITEKVSV
jgi:cysteine desulfurase